ncbi:MAG: hypothetical protein ACTSR8_21365 [Promethearchaeota archaeon]
MISRILIIASGGLLCYSKTFVGGDDVDNDLVSGFLTAVSNFAKEIKGGEIKSLNFKNFNYVYSYDTDLDCMFIIVIDIDDLEEEATNKVELMKDEFISRYRNVLTNWTGDVTIFENFNEFVDKEIFIPPKILLVGEDGVGKSTMMELFPGETVLELDEDLNEIIQKPINVRGLESIQQFILREMDLEDLIENSRLHRPLLNAVDVILIVTNSGASNLGRTLKLFGSLKKVAGKSDFYVIANFQDQKESAFEPDKIQESFKVPTYAFSAIADNAKEEIFKIMVDILNKSIIEKIKEKINAPIEF